MIHKRSCNPLMINDVKWWCNYTGDHSITFEATVCESEQWIWDVWMIHMRLWIPLIVWDAKCSTWYIFVWWVATWSHKCQCDTGLWVLSPVSCMLTLSGGPPCLIQVYTMQSWAPTESPLCWIYLCSSLVVDVKLDLKSIKLYNWLF